MSLPFGTKPLTAIRAYSDPIDRVRHFATLLEHLLDTSAPELRQYNTSATLRDLLEHHQAKFSAFDAVCFAVWVRNELTHAGSKVSEDQAERAALILDQAITNILPYCPADTRLSVSGFGLDPDLVDSGRTDPLSRVLEAVLDRVAEAKTPAAPSALSSPQTTATGASGTTGAKDSSARPSDTFAQILKAVLDTTPRNPPQPGPLTVTLPQSPAPGVSPPTRSTAETGINPLLGILGLVGGIAILAAIFGRKQQTTQPTQPTRRIGCIWHLFIALAILALLIVLSAVLPRPS